MQHRGLTVFFRFDDYAENSPDAVEAGLVDALRQHGLCATFAVIPAVTEGSYHVPGERALMPLGPKKIDFLRGAVDAGAVDVALHGWNHRSRFTASPHSEFVGLTLDEQLDRIGRGREAFRRSLNLDVSVFVPPWNRYDENTLEALTRQGLTCLSANRYGPCRDGALRFAPITADVREIRQAVAAARTSGDPNPIVGVLLHPYDFAESGDPRGDLTCRGFADELRWLRDQADVDVASISELARRNGSLDAARYRANQPLSFESTFPPFIRATTDTPVFRSTDGARRIKATRAAVTLAMYAAAVVAGAVAATVAASALGPGGRRLLALGQLAASAAAAALLGRAALRREIYFKSLLPIAVLAGVIAAGISSC